MGEPLKTWWPLVLLAVVILIGAVVFFSLAPFIFCTTC